MSRPLRLCIVITGLGVGGAEHGLLKLLSRLDRTRIEPSLIVLGREDALAARFCAIGVKPLMLGLKPGRWPLAEFGRLLSAVRACQPDILQGWMYHGNLAASFAASRIKPSPVLCWSVRDTPDAGQGHSLFTRIVIRLCGLYLARVARIFNVSARSAAYCARELGWPAERTTILPNGVDTDVFRPDPVARAALRAELGLGEDVPLVGHVARWHPVKNHALFLAAMARLRESLPGAHCVLVGKGLEAGNAELVALLERHGLTETCHLLGPRSDVQTLYPAFDLLALSSRSEGFPNVLVEAMSCGVPVVTTDVGDARDIVGDTGFVVESSAEAMSDALRVLGDLPRRHESGLLARERVVRCYGLDAVAAGLQEQYRALCA